jgi:hypothetical protein
MILFNDIHPKIKQEEGRKGESYFLSQEKKEKFLPSSLSPLGSYGEDSMTAKTNEGCSN